MSYNVHFQTMPAYKGIKYGQGTVYTSGCGCAALCNALDALGIARVSVKAMCAYAVSVDARVKGGTDEGVLLRNASKKYGFVSVVDDGIIKTSIVQCGKATADRSPSYYLISKSGKGDNKKEVEDMTEAEVRKIIADEAAKQAKLAVSDWAKSAWANAVEAKLLDDDRPQAPMTRQEFAAELKKLGFVGRADMPSDWAKAAWTATEQAGVMTGDPHGYVNREMLAQVLKNTGLVGAGVKE